MKIEGTEIGTDPVFDELDRVTDMAVQISPVIAERLSGQGWRLVDMGSWIDLVPPTETLYDRRGRIRGWLAVDGTVDKR